MSKVRDKKREQTGRGSVWLTMLDLLRGGILGFVVACIVLGLAAILIHSGVIGNGKAQSAVIAACLVGGFAGGVFAVRRVKKAPLPLGLGAGGVLYFMLLALGALLYHAVPQLSSIGATACACLCGGGLSGFVGGAGKRGNANKYKRK